MRKGRSIFRALRSKGKRQLPSPQKEASYKSHRCKMKGSLLKVILNAKSYGLKNITNPATNATAIAIITTQTQMEALASFFSSTSITSFELFLCPINKKAATRNSIFG